MMEFAWSVAILVASVTTAMVAVGVASLEHRRLKHALKLPNLTDGPVTYDEIVSAARRIRKGTYLLEMADLPLPPSFKDLPGDDPNLALIGLRIAIESRLRNMAASRGLPREGPIAQVMRALLEDELLDEPSARGLSQLLAAGNRAAHGAAVEPTVASWVLDFGPSIINELQAITVTAPSP